MNLILLFDFDFIAPHRVRLTGRRFKHIQDILKIRPGKSLTVGRINGLMGLGTLVQEESDALQLEVNLNLKPPQALPLTLILALPRPLMFKRILFSAAMLGVKKIIILNFSRVEKSLWNSSALKSQAITEQLVLGLEQAKDTVMPEVIIKKRFKPFVQDELSGYIKGKLALVAHPDRKIASPLPRLWRGWWQARLGEPSARRGLGRGRHPNKHIILIIGPEGGIIDFEIELLRSAGCQAVDLGPRILRTESVLPFIVGKLF